MATSKADDNCSAHSHPFLFSCPLSQLLYYSSLDPKGRSYKGDVLHHALAMRLQPMSAHRVAYRAPNPRKKYTAGRAFYLTILVISIFAVWSLVVPGRFVEGRGTDGKAPQRGILVKRDVGLARRGEEVWTARKKISISCKLLKSCSVAWFTRLMTNAPMFARIASMKKQDFYPTSSSTIAKCTAQNLSPS